MKRGGCKETCDVGAYTLAQGEKTGVSGACQVVKLGGVDKIVPLAEVAANVLTLVER